jgi:RHS repeat-associated protein
MRFSFFLLYLFQLSAEITIRETASNGSWLEAHINDDKSLKELLFSDGSRVVYEYENSSLRKIKRIDSQGIELYSHTYDWENSKLQNHVGWFITQYLYDCEGRLVAKLNPWQQETVSYNSQREIVQIGHRIYSYDQSGQITREHGYFDVSYDENCNLKELNCEYDNFGNCIRKSYVYNEKNQLLEACNNYYSYDNYGRRTQKNDIFYLNLGFEEIASFENGYCKTLKIPGIGGPVAIEINGKPYAPVVDALGIIRKLIDPSDNSIFAENDCDVFGSRLTDAIPYAYRGKRYDTETGLIYFGKRYYDPQWHRWLTPDPLGSIDHENLYQYVYNNPVRYSDPTGCSFWGYVLGLGEIIAGGTLMIAGGVVEIGSFGALTLGVAVAETSGAALIADGWTRAIHESKDVQLPKWDKRFETDSQRKETTKKPPRFNGEDLGKDPSKCPEKGFEWRGKGSPESGKGNWINPNTGEKLHPDLEHPPGKDPHWGYVDPNGAPYDLFLNGSWK